MNEESLNTSYDPGNLNELRNLKRITRDLFQRNINNLM